MIQKKNLLYDVIETLKKAKYLTVLVECKFLDIIAKREYILLIKVLENLNSFKEEDSIELKKLSSLLNASPLIVSSRYDGIYLLDNVVYERYKIPAINVETFKKFILYSINPRILFFKGKFYVKIDSRKLRMLREEMKLSLKEIAEKLNVSREMIYRYEREISRIEYRKAIHLEEMFAEDLILDINILNYEKYEAKKEKTNDYIFRKLERIGLEIYPIKKFLFNAITRDENLVILTKRVKKRNELENISRLLEISKVTEKNAIVISKRNYNLDIPLINEDEIKKIKTKEDFVNILFKKIF